MSTIGFESSSGYSRNQYGVAAEHLTSGVTALMALESGDKLWIELSFVGQDTSIEGTLIGSSSGIQFSRQDVVGGDAQASGDDNPPDVSRSEAEAGVEAASRLFSPLRVKQAIDSLASNLIASWARHSAPSGTIPDVRIPSSIARDSEVTTAVSNRMQRADIVAGTNITLANGTGNSVTISASGGGGSTQTGPEIVALLEALTGDAMLNEDAIEGAFTNAKLLTNSDNLNNVLPGVYKWSASTPTNATGTHGALLAFARSNNPDISIQIELRAPAGIPQMRFRSFNGGASAWEAWSPNAVAPIVSVSDAEAGTSTTEFSWTPQRIAQAITALAPAGDVITDIVTNSSSGLGGGTTSGSANMRLHVFNLPVLGGELAANDTFPVADEDTAGDPTRKVSLASIATKLAGSALTAINGVLSIPNGAITQAELANARIINHGRLETAVTDALVQTPGDDQENGEVWTVNKDIAGHKAEWGPAGDVTGAPIYRENVNFGTKTVVLTDVVPPTNCKKIKVAFRQSSDGTFWTNEIEVAYANWLELTELATATDVSKVAVCLDDPRSGVWWCLARGTGNVIAVGRQVARTGIKVSIQFVT